MLVSCYFKTVSRIGLLSVGNTQENLVPNVLWTLWWMTWNYSLRVTYIQPWKLQWYSCFGYQIGILFPKFRFKNLFLKVDLWHVWDVKYFPYFSSSLYYQVWNRSLVQVGCMRQVLGAGTLGRPRGVGWVGRWEGGSGWGIHVNPWLIQVNVWQNPLQYCKVMSPQLIKINEKKKS